MTVKEFKMQTALGTLSYANKIKLAYARRTPKKVLAILSNDISWCVKEGIATNRNTPVKILEKLSKDENEWIRFNAKNNSTLVS